jgi:hypothetical protein
MLCPSCWMTPEAGLPPGGHPKGAAQRGERNTGRPGSRSCSCRERTRVPGDRTLSGTRCLAAWLRTKRAANHDRRTGGGPTAIGRPKAPADVTIVGSASRRMDARPVEG